jgi:hypothetical protein
VLWAVVGTTDPNVPLAQAAVSIVPSEWQPSPGYTTAKACQDALSEPEKNELDAMMKRNKAGAAVWNTYRFRCLPDTVDPRGPKGK